MHFPQHPLAAVALTALLTLTPTLSHAQSPASCQSNADCTTGVCHNRVCVDPILVPIGADYGLTLPGLLTPRPPGGLPPGTEEVCCILRVSHTGRWHCVQDEAHTPIRVDSVTEKADGSVDIAFDFDGANVIAASIDPDETYGPLGITAGMSLGASHATVRFGRPVEPIAGYVRYNGARWLWNGTGIEGVTFTGGTLQVFHRTLEDDENAFDVSAVARAQNGVLGYIPMIGSVGMSSTSIVFADGQQIASNPDRRMAFFFRRAGIATTPVRADELPGGGNFWVRILIERSQP